MAIQEAWLARRTALAGVRALQLVHFEMVEYLLQQFSLHWASVDRQERPIQYLSSLLTTAYSVLKADFAAMLTKLTKLAVIIFVPTFFGNRKRNNKLGQ